MREEGRGREGEGGSGWRKGGKAGKGGEEGGKRHLPPSSSFALISSGSRDVVPHPHLPLLFSSFIFCFLHFLPFSLLSLSIYFFFVHLFIHLFVSVRLPFLPSFISTFIIYLFLFLVVLVVIMVIPSFPYLHFFASISLLSRSILPFHYSCVPLFFPIMWLVLSLSALASFLLAYFSFSIHSISSYPFSNSFFSPAS